jgi:hypothetical protein
MHGTIRTSSRTAISASAELCQSRHDSAEPLWFALLCRYLWGGNAPKDLEFALARNHDKRSDRTCRAWAAGDSPPQVNTLVLLQRDHQCGERVLQYVMRDCDAPWWLELQAARALCAQFQIIKRE